MGKKKNQQQCHVDFVCFFFFSPIKSEKFECSWSHRRDVLKAGNPSFVSTRCQTTPWVRASFRNHCLLTRQHCHRPLFGTTAWTLRYQNISILCLSKRNWKSPLLGAGAWRRCFPGGRDPQYFPGRSHGSRSRAGEDRRRLNLQACSLPRRTQCRTCVEQTWVPGYLLAFACLKLLAAVLWKERQSVYLILPQSMLPSKLWLN